MNNRVHELMLHTCTWCMNPIPPGGEIFAFGVKAREIIDLSKMEGEFVSLDLTKEKSVVAIVTEKNSEARKQGYDLIFLTCSQTCAEELRGALWVERDLFKD